MTRQRDPDRREDEGRMSVFVTAAVFVLLVLCAAARGLADTPAAQAFVEMVR